MLFSSDFLKDFLQSDFIQQNPQYKDFVHNESDETDESISTEPQNDGHMGDIENNEEANSKDNHDKYNDIESNFTQDGRREEFTTRNAEDNIDLVELTDSDSDMEDEEIIEEEVIKDPLAEHTDSDNVENVELRNNLSENVVEDVVNVILQEKPEFGDFNNDIGESNFEEEEIHETDDVNEELSNGSKTDGVNEDQFNDISDDVNEDQFNDISDDVHEDELNDNLNRPKLKQGRIPKPKPPQGSIHNLRNRKDEGLKIVNNAPIELSDESSDEEIAPIELSDESGNEEDVNIRKKPYKYSGVTITKINENQEGNGLISNRRRDNVVEGKSVEEFLLRERRNNFAGYNQDYENTLEESSSYYEDDDEYYDEEFENKYNCSVHNCDLVFSDDDVEYGGAVHHIRFEHTELSMEEIIEKLEHFEDIVSDNKYILFQDAEVILDLTDSANEGIILKKSEKLKTANKNEDIIEFECEYECEVCGSDKMTHGAAFLHLTVHHDFNDQQIEINLG